MNSKCIHTHVANRKIRETCTDLSVRIDGGAEAIFLEAEVSISSQPFCLYSRWGFRRGRSHILSLFLNLHLKIKNLVFKV